MKPRNMNNHMKAAAKAYGGGDYAYLADYDFLTEGDLDNIGDGLFRFIMIELSSEEDCDSVEMAISRMQTARRDLNDVLSALDALP